MRHKYLWFLPTALLLLSACRFWLPETTPNPDPNHTHADFAVWVDGERLDFSGSEFMSGSSADTQEGEHMDENHKHPHLHLHNGNGHVIHRHKSGLSLRDFFSSIGITFSRITVDAKGQDILCPPGSDRCTDCIQWHGQRRCNGEFGGMLRMWVNEKEMIPCNPDDVFHDLDRILIVFTRNDADIPKAVAAMTSDACLYSQTCPRRGKPPTESCLADPAVPCTE